MSDNSSLGIIIAVGFSCVIITIGVVTVGPLKEIDIRYLSFSDNDISQGENTELFFKLVNESSEYGVENVQIIVYAIAGDSIKVADNTRTCELLPGHEKTFSFTVSVSPDAYDGTYTVVASVFTYDDFEGDTDKICLGVNWEASR